MPVGHMRRGSTSTPGRPERGRGGRERRLAHLGGQRRPVHRSQRPHGATARVVRRVVELAAQELHAAVGVAT
jgi:hypothetical protein